MTAIEAICYCLGYVGDDEDGEVRSRTVYDSTGEPHWIAWDKKKGHLATPEFRSGSPYPFAASLDPYTVEP